MRRGRCTRVSALGGAPLVGGTGRAGLSRAARARSYRSVEDGRGVCFRIPRPDPSPDLVEARARYARNGSMNETNAEVERLERHALVVAVHTLLVRLHHRERQDAVRLDSQAA